MKEYFQLQFKILNRKIIAFGMPVFLAYIFVPIIFVLFSDYMFSKIEFSRYVYMIIALSFVSKLSEIKRNDFLKSIFKRTGYLKIRLLENLIYMLPFVFFLTYKNQFIFAFLLIIFALFLVFIKSSFAITIPTPFAKKPFEYVVGFRNTFFVFPIAYFLGYISVMVSNFNLGVFSMLLIGIICLTYYSKTETKYYVWSFNLSPKEFLIQKVEICLMYFTALNMPVLLILCVFFFNKIDIILVVFILCYAFLITIIFAKYSVFPNQMGLPQTILIILSVIFPPMLILVIPYFYKQSIKQLNTVLE